MSAPTPRATAAIRTATTRRRFMKLAAAGSVAMLVGGADRPAAAAAPAKRKAAKPAPKPVEPAPDALRQEIESQKGYLARALKTVREYPLRPGATWRSPSSRSRRCRRRAISGAGGKS
jgi:hypothetical protein